MRLSPAALLLALLLDLPASSCAPSLTSGKEGQLRIVAYNVKSLFDAHDDGTEFPEFSVAKGTWNDSLYKIRLANVAKAVYAAVPEPGPDLVCLEEIENRGVLEALRTGPLSVSRYGFAAMAPSEGGPFADGLLSRLPILSASCLSASTPAGRAGRDMLEVEIDAGSGQSPGSGKIFVISCHWKSKTEGDEATEEARREDAALLRSRVEALLAADPEARIVACGDFNESPDEYVRVGRRYPTALMPVEEGSGPDEAPSSGPFFDRILVASSAASAAAAPEPALYSPWADSEGFSYAYHGSRERIDGFLLSPALVSGSSWSFEGFAVADGSFLLDDKGDPYAWPGKGAEGYSDHLPVTLTLERRP